MSINHRFFIICALLLLPLTTQAKLFSNSYISFELPPRWDCSSEGTEWICRSADKQEAREAIIILTAKEVGPTDSLVQYEAFLKQPKTIPGTGAKPFVSQVKDVKTRKIADHDWVDALHLGSEIPTYYTRYLATVKKNVAILVTFSAHTRYYTKYSTDFFNAIQSLKVINIQTVDKNLAPLRPGSETLGANISKVMPNDMITDPNGEYPDEDSEPSDTKMKLFLFGIIILAIGGYFFIKQKDKKKT